MPGYYLSGLRVHLSAVLEAACFALCKVPKFSILVRPTHDLQWQIWNDEWQKEIQRFLLKNVQK